MRLSMKQMLWLWIAIMMMVGLLFGMAYQRFNGEALVAGLQKELQRVYPQSEVNIGNISTSFLVDINLSLENLSVTKNNKKELSLKHLELKIPWWSLLVDSGRIQLNIEGLILHLPQKQSSIKVLESQNKKKEVISKELVQLSLPSYIANSSLNIRVKDLELIDPDLNERRLNLSKVIIRDYKVGSKTAFELNIPLSIKWGGSYKGEIWVFGDFISSGQQVHMSWRADARGFNQENWNLNDLFVEGKGLWEPQAQNLEAKITLIHSSKRISELEIKSTHQRLSVKGPINQLPVEIIKPLIKQFHPRPQVSFFKGSELGNGHFSWNYTWPGTKSHFDLRLGFEGDFYQEPGFWNLEWISEAYGIDFVASDKKLRFEGKWGPQKISHKVSLEGRSIESEFFNKIDPLLVNIYPVDEQNFEISLHDVIWKESNYTGKVLSQKKPLLGDSRFEMKLSNEKNVLDFNWSKLMSSNGKKSVFFKAINFPVGPFGSYFHQSLDNSPSVINGKLEASWSEDLYAGKGFIAFSLTNFSSNKQSWKVYWDFIANNFSFSARPEEINIQADWKDRSLKLKKLSVLGNNLKGVLTGKLDFNGKKSELIWQDQSIPGSKKLIKNFIITDFMRSL
ncbi:MAG: hypothetical protein ACOVP4_06405 [Bacteriovoracaceae bacterium]